MKTRLLLFSLAALTAQAADTQTIDLGNGTKVEVKDGKVSVKSNASGEGNQSASSSVNSSSNGDGTTTTTVTSERNGQSVTRTFTINKDGKVDVADAAAPGAPATTPDGGWMGVHTAAVPDAVRGQVDLPEGQGVVAEFIAKDGPAAKAGLTAHDILLKLNGQPIASVEDFRAKLSALKPGAQAEVEYMRKGKTATAAVTLGERPADAPADDKVAGEAGRLLRDLQKKGDGNTRRTMVIGSDGKVTIKEHSSSSSSSSGGSTSGGSGTDAFDALLNDPNVPEEMKEHLRKTREEMKKLQDSVKP